jgi:hypothetical protein
VQGRLQEYLGGLLRVSIHMVATARIYAYRSFECDRSVHGSSIVGSTLSVSTAPVVRVSGDFRLRHSLCKGEHLGAHHSGLVRDITHLVATPVPTSLGPRTRSARTQSHCGCIGERQCVGYTVWDFRDPTDGGGSPR